jgi:hypothetical protein
MKVQFTVLAAAAMLLSGCTTYVYRIVQPPDAPHLVADQPVGIHYDPLDYQLSRDHDRLAMLISNPTEERIALLGFRSYVVDPQGESHPVQGMAIGPHSFGRLSLPPPAVLVPYTDYWSWGWGWGWGWHGWYDPYWGPYGGYVGPPPVSYARIPTPFDWSWKTGAARFRFAYERNTNFFEHDFEIVREPAK